MCHSWAEPHAVRSCRRPRCRKTAYRISGSSPGFGEGVFPLETVSNGEQEPSTGWHVVVVIWLDLFPAVCGRVSCRNAEHLSQPRLAVAAMISKGLARPFAR